MSITPLILRINGSQIFVSLWFFFIPGTLTAQPTLILEEYQNIYPLGKYLEILEDVEGKWSIEEVSSPQVSKNFVLSQVDVPNFGFTPSVYWVRFQIENSRMSQKKWLLEFSFPPMEQIELYFANENGTWSVKKAGKLYPFEQRDFAHPHYIFPLMIPENQSYLIYMRFDTLRAMQLPLTLWEPSAFAEKRNQEIWEIGAYIGIMVVMAFYNLFIFFSVRDKSYLYYVCYILSFILVIMNFKGIASQYLWSNSPWWASNSISFLIPLTLFWILLFSQSFLQTQVHLPWIHKSLNLLIGLALLLMTLSFFRLGWFFRLNIGTTILSSGLIITAAILSWKRGFQAARFFLLAWITLLAGFITFALQRLGVLSHAFWAEYGIQIGSVLEVVFLSLSLADRINILQQEKEEAQRETFLLHQQTAEHLEAQVQERTAKLTEANEDLSKEIEAHTITEESLRESERKNKAFLDLIPDLMFRLNQKGDILDFRAAITEDLVLPPAEVIGSNIKDALPPEVVRQCLHAIDRALDAGTVQIFEYRLQIQQGNQDFEARLITSGEEDVLVIVRNVTERKQHEAQLKIFSDAIRVSMDGINITDNEGFITYSNVAVAKMFGYKEGELIGKHVNIFNSEENEMYSSKVIIPAIQQHGYWSGEVQQKRKDGSTFPIFLTTSSIKRDQDEVIGMLGICHDITRQKATEQELKMAKVQAEQANRSKSQFLANLTHDIRTPLGAILGFNQILLNKGRALTLPEEFRRFQENIQTSAQNLLEMLNNFLDVSKIEAGKMRIIEEDFQIETLIKNVFTTHELQAHQKDIIFTYEISPQLPKTMRSDRTKLIRILTNLVSNAIKFTPTGKAVTLRVMGDEQIVVFLIIDQGIGIPQDRQHCIFDEFEQVEDTTVDNNRGTGLGLAITKKLVEMLGGKISLMSQIHQGTNFHVRIPYQEASASFPETNGTKVAEDMFPQDSVILVVEDNPMNQSLIEALFKELGLSIQFANDGKLGLEQSLQLMAAGSPPDIIFMDIQMPVMGGVEATQEIRKASGGQHIPVVALSADAYTGQQKDALAAGMNDYLTKPIDIIKLRAVLNKYLIK